MVSEFGLTRKAEIHRMWNWFLSKARITENKELFAYSEVYHIHEGGEETVT